RLSHVSHSYAATDESAPVQVLDDVSLDIVSGDFAVLMGASGSGKSTLLNLMGAVDKPTLGRVFLDDTETSLLDEKRLTMLRRPPLILADEPTGNLDSRNGEMILDLLRQVHGTRRPTVIMATHSDRAALRGDYVVRIADGRVVP